MERHQDLARRQKPVSGKAESRLVHIRLLGGLDVRYGAERVSTLESPRLQSLLAYLLLHRETAQQRQHLAFVLWPDSTESQARTNLRQLLHHLRRAIPESESLIEVGAASIQWRADGPFSLDVAQYELAADLADEDGDAAAREALEGAVALYGGELLPGCYDEWILPERERLRDRNIELLERLTTLLEEERDYRGAARYAELLLRSDPLHESTYRRLMRLHALCGDFTGELFDEGTGLYHLRARQYDAELGRFTARDPMPPLLTDPYVSSYVYASARPTVFSDPSGLCSLCDFLSDVSTVSTALATAFYGGTMIASAAGLGEPYRQVATALGANALATIGVSLILELETGGFDCRASAIAYSAYISLLSYFLTASPKTAVAFRASALSLAASVGATFSLVKCGPSPAGPGFSPLTSSSTPTK